MSEEMPKLTVGFITYGDNTAKYLPYFLPSLIKQKIDNLKILVVDNTEGEENFNLNYLKDNYPDIEIIKKNKNLGFSRAYNIMIKRALDNGSKYFCALNPDMVLEDNSLSELIEKIDKDDNLGSVSPRILKWNFDKKEKTKQIDTLGIKLLPGLRFVDADQGSEENESFKDLEILGPSGAAGVYRLSGLEKIKVNNQYFDELMFMYKEDCDLDYRLFLAGYKSLYVSEAVIYHDRTVFSRGENDLKVVLNRKSKNKKVKEWSFLNQHIIFLKFWSRQTFLNKIKVTWFAFKMFVFVLIFERYLFKQYFKLFKIRNNKK